MIPHLPKHKKKVYAAFLQIYHWKRRIYFTVFLTSVHTCIDSRNNFGKLYVADDILTVTVLAQLSISIEQATKSQGAVFQTSTT